MTSVEYWRYIESFIMVVYVVKSGYSVLISELHAQNILHTECMLSTEKIWKI